MNFERFAELARNDFEESFALEMKGLTDIEHGDRNGWRDLVAALDLASSAATNAGHAQALAKGAQRKGDIEALAHAISVLQSRLHARIADKLAAGLWSRLVG